MWRAVLGPVAALLLAVAAAGTAAAAPAPPAAVAAGTWDGRTRLTVTTPGAAPPTDVTVVVDGAPRPAAAVPLLSDRTATVVVVDASAAGASTAAARLSGATDAVLAAPPAARTAVVADTDPPAVVAPLRVGPADALRGLAAVRTAGERRTAEALALALEQLPPEPDAPRLVLLDTAAPDTPVPAGDLAARLAAAGAVLAVVAPAVDGAAPPYWSAVAAATGGVAVGAAPAGVVAAFDAVTAALRARWLLTFPAPGRLPATALVRAETAAGPVAATVPLAAPAPDRGARDAGAGRPRAAPVVLSLVALAVLLVGVGTVVRRRRSRGRAGAAGDAGPGPAAPRPGPAPPAGTAWNVPARPDPVVARDGLLDAVERALGQGRPVVLHPAAGVSTGTTTALVEYAHRHRPDYDVVWWVPAADAPLAADRLAELAELLGLAAATDPADAAVARLRAELPRRRRWLLVLDDAAGPRQLAGLLPAGPGHVLVGSADPEWAGHGVAVAVPALRRDESVRLLGARRPGLSTARADRLAAALGDDPLAVDVAGATLAAAGLDADTYLLLLDRAGAAAGGRADPPAGPAAAACGVALDLLAAGSPVAGRTGGPAATAATAATATAATATAATATTTTDADADRAAALALLALLARLGSDPVPLSLLTARPDLLPDPLRAAAAAPDRLRAVLAELGRRGLARVDTDAGTVAVPRVAAAVLLARSTPPEASTWAGTAVRLLRAALPEDTSGPRGRAAWRRTVPHVLAATDPARPLDDVALEVGWLLQHAGSHLRERGETRAARALLDDAHDLYARRLGPDHPDTVAAAAAREPAGGAPAT